LVTKGTVKSLGDLAAQEQGEFRPRCKSPGEPFGRFLLFSDEQTHQAVMSGECGDLVTRGAVKFSGQHIGRDHRRAEPSPARSEAQKAALPRTATY
jgi:hypothetical protein